MDKELLRLAEEIEAAFELDAGLTERARATLASYLKRPIDEVDLESTDDVITLVYEIKPGWNMSMKGKAWSPNGHWHCTLRQTELRDNDAYIGVGNGPTLSHALLASLLKAIAQAGG